MPKPPWPPHAELSLVTDHLWGHACEGHRFALLPDEEALTQVAMLSLARRRFQFTSFRGRLPAASDLRIRKFTLGQEGKTGADWNLLLFDATGGRVSFRIQAKRLFSDGKFGNLKPAQTKRLLDLSARQGAVPLFALYQGPQHLPTVSACQLPGANNRMGCVVRHATTLAAAAPKTSAAWQSEAALGLPLQCLAGCHCYGAGATPNTGDGPPTRGEAPRSISASEARNVVGTSAQMAARNTGGEGIARLAITTDSSSNFPDDRLGDYWDERRGNFDELDEEGRQLFEDISHLVVIDSRRNQLAGAPLMRDDTPSASATATHGMIDDASIRVGRADS